MSLPEETKTLEHGCWLGATFQLPLHLFLDVGARSFNYPTSIVRIFHELVVVDQGPCNPSLYCLALWKLIWSFIGLNQTIMKGIETATYMHLTVNFSG